MACQISLGIELRRPATLLESILTELSIYQSEPQSMTPLKLLLQR
jgi:hypothetical protein